MKTFCALLILGILFGSAGAAQTRKRSGTQSRTPKGSPTPPRRTPTAPALGAAVTVVTKNGDQISGTLLDLNNYGVRIKTGNLESSYSLDSVASISLGGVAAGSKQTPAGPSSAADFPKDSDVIVRSLQAIGSAVSSGIDYTEYGRQLIELRRGTERYISKYATSENVVEARTAALLAGALNDYTWARAIWTLKLGYSGNSLVTESDLQVADALALYPELRSSAASSGKFSVDKLTAGLWRKAAEKADRINVLAGRR